MASEHIDNTSYDYLVAALLGAVQGAGEFLPISSSAHLIVARWLLGLEDTSLNGMAYDVALHMGTTGALIPSTWREWVEVEQTSEKPWATRARLVWVLGVASAPGAVAGYLLDDLAETSFRSPLLVAGTLATVGVLLDLADHRGSQSRMVEELCTRDALVVGLAQACALVPGVSRSGATIAMSRALGLRRDQATRLSFLMALPIITGAMAFKLKDVDASEIRGPFILGVVVSGGVGAAAIRFLLRYLADHAHSFRPFAVYRLLLALLIVVISLKRSGAAGSRRKQIKISK